MRKQFSRELNAAELLFDSLFMTSSIDSKYRLRCPLLCKVDYRGFRAIAIATMPIRPERGMALGFDGEGRLQQLDGQLATELRDVGQVLNLSDYKTKVKKTLFDGKSGGGGGTASQHQLAVEVQQFESVPISNFVRVYSQAEGMIEELRSSTLKTLRRETRQLLRSHYIEPIQYVLKTDNIFPMDLDYEGHQKDQKGAPAVKTEHHYDRQVPHRDQVLRQELFTNYEVAVKADLKKHIPGQMTRADYLQAHQLAIRDPEELKDVQDLDNLSKHLQQDVIRTVVNMFADLKEIPVSSFQLKQVFHSHGINMRYLGKVANMVSLHHIKQLCVTEMIARTAKNIFNEQISSSILAAGEPESTGPHSGSPADPGSMTLFVRRWTIDFLNLLLGSSEEHAEFWHTILLPRAAAYFGYSLQELKQFEVKGTALYFAFLDLTNLAESRGGDAEGRMFTSGVSGHALADVETPFTPVDGRAEEPFELLYKHFLTAEKPFGEPEHSAYKITFRPRTRGYAMKGMPYRIISERAKDYLAQGRVEQAIKASHMKRIFSQSVNGHDDVQGLLELCEIAVSQKQWT